MRLIFSVSFLFLRRVRRRHLLEEEEEEEEEEFVENRMKHKLDMQLISEFFRTP